MLKTWRITFYWSGRLEYLEFTCSLVDVVDNFCRKGFHPDCINKVELMPKEHTYGG